MKARLTALNVHDAVMRLTEGGCDLLIAYHHPSEHLQLSPERYDMLSLGSETLAPYLDAIFETDIAEGLKAMVLAGHGLAFLPHSSARKELKSRRLVAAAPAGQFALTMEVRIDRERPDSNRPGKAGVQALWEFLASV